MHYYTEEEIHSFSDDVLENFYNNTVWERDEARKNCNWNINHGIMWEANNFDILAKKLNSELRIVRKEFKKRNYKNSLAGWAKIIIK